MGKRKSLPIQQKVKKRQRSTLKKQVVRLKVINQRGGMRNGYGLE